MKICIRDNFPGNQQILATVLEDDYSDIHPIVKFAFENPEEYGVFKRFVESKEAPTKENQKAFISSIQEKLHARISSSPGALTISNTFGFEYEDLTKIFYLVVQMKSGDKSITIDERLVNQPAVSRNNREPLALVGEVIAPKRKGLPPPSPKSLRQP